MLSPVNMHLAAPPGLLEVTPLPSPMPSPAKMHRAPPGLPEVTEPVPPPPAPIIPREKLPSVGAALHGTGMCKPCGWFHKEGGCRNGQDCRHCHLCPASEFKARKKDKFRAAAAGGDEETPARAKAAAVLP